MGAQAPGDDVQVSDLGGGVSSHDPAPDRCSGGRASAADAIATGTTASTGSGITMEKQL